jgi:nucleoside-diphosphate-sugar epimerase
MSAARRTPAVLVTGASGYVGGLLAAALLQDEGVCVILPVRRKHALEKIRARLAVELRAAGVADAEPHLDRIVTLPLPPTAELASQLVPELTAALRPYEVTEIVHAAGCLSYFNAARLDEGNQQLTALFIALGRALGVRRFVYVSTAYSSGYVHGPVLERLHGPPASDPNEYTRSKRETEHLVAAGGLPFLILRPSIVIGHSRHGGYTGKPYGAYQVWTGLTKFLCDRRRAVIHAVAPDVPLNFVHQDALQSGFVAALRHAPDGSIAHLVSRDDRVPTTRQYWDMWIRACARPREVRYVDRLADLPWRDLDQRERMLMNFAEANIEISTHHWQFRTDNLERLRPHAPGWVDATPATVGVCLRAFLARTPRALAFMVQQA